jgi:ABC-2 type transport system ATP-binding protein
VPLVQTTKLTKRFGDRVALDAVDISIDRGVTGLLGANGAGKTTLLRLVLGLAHPDAGQISVFDRDPRAQAAEVRALIGWSPEHDSLPPDVRAQDLVRHLAEVHGLPPRAALGRASDALTEVGLSEERFRPIGTMSTGQKQRVKLATAIAHDPTLVLLDEPTNGLDPMQREDMLRLIRRIGNEFGLNVIVSSHLLGEVERICDNVVMLAEGRLVAQASLASLRTGDDRYVVELDADAQRVFDAVVSAGIDAESIAPASFTMTVGEDGRELDVVRDAIAAAGIGLRRLQQRTATLESLFFAETVTGDGSDG